MHRTMMRKIITFLIVIIALTGSLESMALLSDQDLAEKHMPIMRLSTTGGVGVDLTDNGCTEYDYKPIAVHNIASNTSNLPQLVDVSGGTSVDLTFNDIDSLGNETGKYVDITAMYTYLGVKNPSKADDEYCNLPLRPTTVYYQVFHDEQKAYPVAIQYWFFYFYNDWVGNHPGDWETISVFFDADQNPEETVYSTHYEANRYVWGQGDMAGDGSQSDRPRVYVSNGGHGSYAYADDTAYSNWGTNDNHMGDAGAPFTSINGVNLAPLRADTSSWLNFDGRWGDENKAPHGPPLRIDATTEDVPWLPDGDTFWDKAINKPYYANCNPRTGTSIYSNSGPWEWADGYRRFWDESDPCLQQPVLNGVSSTNPLTVQWFEVMGSNGSSVESYEVIVRSADGLTNTSRFLSNNGSDYSCVGGLCSATLSSISLQDEQQHYWFVRGTQSSPQVSSPWSERGELHFDPNTPPTINIIHTIEDYYVEPIEFESGYWVRSHNLNSLTGDVEIKSGTVSVTGSSTIQGNLILSGGTLDLDGQSLHVTGYLIHEGGTLNIGSGSLTIERDYRGQTINEDSVGILTYTSGYGLLRMLDDFSYMLVKGDFIQDSLYGGAGIIVYGDTNYNSYSLLAGTLELRGDFEQRSTNSKARQKVCNSPCPTFNKRYTTYYGLHNFRSQGTHKVLLSGTDKQLIGFDDPGISGAYTEAGSHFNVLEITNTSAEGVDFLTLSPVVTELKVTSAPLLNASNIHLWGGQLTGGTWPGDLTYRGVVLSSSNQVSGDVYVIDNLDLNGQVLQVGGHLFISNGTFDFNSGVATVVGKTTQTGGTVLIGTGSLNISADYFQNGGTLNLTGSMFNVPRDYLHEGGTLNIGSGNLTIERDYRGQTINEDSVGALTYTSGYGLLRMLDDSSYMLVKGDFIQDSLYGGAGINIYGDTNYNSYSLLAGTLELRGDFEQQSTNSRARQKVCNSPCPTFNKRYTTYYGLHNFRSQGTHKVLLSGTDKQLIGFDDPGISGAYAEAGSHFNVLELNNRSHTGVVFETPFHVTQLFDHQGNQFSFLDTAHIPDYDSDGQNDDVDTSPKGSIAGDAHPTLRVIHFPATGLSQQLDTIIRVEDDHELAATSYRIYANDSVTPGAELIEDIYYISGNQSGHTHDWNINISGLTVGDYQAAFAVTDSAGQVTEQTRAFSTGDSTAIPSVTTPQISESGDPANIFTFSVTLAQPLPAGYGVFLNFDDQQGSWFAQNSPGGHMALPLQSGSIYSVNYTLTKPGLRSFRAGVFDLNDAANLSDDVLFGRYSDPQTCTLPACLAAVTRVNGYGDPAITGSGSQLFKNVDVANGNYHLSTTDISIPGKGPSFAFSRAYNSKSEQSRQWTFAYEMKAQLLAGTYDRELAIGPREDGHMQYFFKDIDQAWYALNPGDFDQLVESANGEFVLYTKGNRLYRFSDPSDANNGRLQSIEDRLGNALTLSYTSGDLVGATDANGRSYVITRDVGNNRIKRVTDFSGRYVEYVYDVNEMITGVRNMRGEFQHYSYVGTSGDDRYRLKTITDPRGNQQLEIQYLVNGRVEKLIDGVNQETSFDYGTDNVSGAPVTGIHQPVVDSLNHNRAYILDADRTRVEEVVDAQSFGDFRTKQSYKQVVDRSRLPEQSLVTRIIEPKNISADVGSDIVYSADGKGNPNEVTDAKGRKTTATYGSVAWQPNLTPVASVKQPGVSTAARYQAFTTTGKATQTIDALNNTSARSYDGNDWMTGSTDANNHSTSFSYDAYGSVLQVTNALGHAITRTYDALSRLETETSALGLVTTYTYDEHGNVLSRNEQASGGINHTAQYGYDESDNLVWVIDPLNHRRDYVYDVLNRKIEENYTVGGIPYARYYTYDAVGRLSQVTNERGQNTETHYTSRSKVKYSLNPLGQTTVTYSYDKNGNVATSMDAEGRSISTSYDELNRKVRVEDDAGNFQTWSYNPAGQVGSHQDSRGKTTSYEYDAVSNLTRLTDPDGGITDSVYDAAGSLLEVTDPSGHKTTYTYDELDRRKTTTLHDGQQWQYTYDANGNRLTALTPTGEKTVKVYDALNRVIQLTEYAANSSVTRQITKTYDANNRVLDESDGSTTIAYTYDELGRVTSVTDHFGQTIGYAYDKVGNRTALTYPGSKVVSYAYDDADQLQSLTDWAGDTTSYNRNDAGQLTQVVYGNGAKAQYAYDVAGRLTLLENLKADNSVISRHNLTLDGAENITHATVNLPIQPALPESIGSLTYDNNNRILTAGTKSYTHDSSGRIIEEDINGAQAIYNFDVNDHITSVTNNGTLVSSYAYDLNNNRISHTQNGVETHYVIDQLARLPNVLAETDNMGAVLHYYIYGEGLVSQIDASGNRHYYHYDSTGHTLALTDDSGNVTDKYAYTPYGKTVVEGNTHNPFRFVGKHGVMDDDNGLHYMRARYYKEDIKRFMSLDALHGEVVTPQSLNRYAYAQGNPVMGIDPSGNSSEYSWRQKLAISFVDSVKHNVQTVKIVAYTGVDFFDVYVGEPAHAAIDYCTLEIEYIENKYIRAGGCISGATSSIAGGGLDVLNPTTFINASLRTPIRYISNGDRVFEKELQNVTGLVTGLLSIRKSIKNATHFHSRLKGAKKAVKTIMEKVNNNRGLAMSRANYRFYAHKYHETLLDALQLAEKSYEYGESLLNRYH